MTSETLTVEIAPVIAEQIDCLIKEGIFASRDELVSYVLRRSLFSEDEEDL
ncbi:hypothetical protein [Candidatus Methanomassiliicoccus intestinalis]|uniref:hypothetical protein n=1 Tax=Candidatus Methanomassiliicoccus intestinalis TaxID=1406512 RepID=UPI0037DC019A